MFQSMNLDTIMLSTFLIVNLAVGLYYGRGINTLKDYAIGSRDFSTATLTATIIATWISGSFFTICISESYKNGVWFLVAGTGQIATLLSMGLIFGPRIKEFFGSLSVAECMGQLYGKSVRVITAIASIAQAIGFTAIQLQVFSIIFNYFFGITGVSATILSSLIVVLYSAFGGIRSVIFTDIIQFITFGIFIPLFALFVWGIFGGLEHITYAFQNNPLLDFSQLINPSNPKFFPFLFLLFYFIMPGLESTMFQRMLMAKNVKQISRSFINASLIYLVLHLCASLIGIIVLAHDSTLNPKNIVMFILDKYSFPGLKGLTLIGIIAMLMSTADSWINTGAVIFTNDLLKPLGITVKRELLLSRFFALFVGCAAILLGLSAPSLLKLVLLQANFYMPIVTVPLMLAILGFRSSSRAVLFGMACGASTVLIWRWYIQHLTDIDSIIPAMAVNLVGFLALHYILGEPGGWIKRSKLSLPQYSLETDLDLDLEYDIPKEPSTTGIIAYCKATAPKDDISYIYFAIAALSTLVPIFSIDRDTYLQHTDLIGFLETITLGVSTIFICHKFWPDNLKEKYIAVSWYLSIFIILSFTSSLLVLLSKFSQLSFMTFILNLTMIGMMVQWRAALLLIIAGIVLALATHGFFVGVPETIEFYSTQLKVLYLLMTLSGGLLAFLKPKQDNYELTRTKNDHYVERIKLQKEELGKLLELKMEFLNNLNHEVRTPITIMTSAGQLLATQYDELSEQARREAIEHLARGSKELIRLMDNLLDLSKISSLVYDLKLKEVDLGALAQERADACRHLYLDDKELNFTYNFEKNVLVLADEYYLKQALDHLILNAIKYTNEGEIILEVSQDEPDKVKFNIEDTGIGIPEEELFEVFGPLIVSSRTHNVDGKGIGLALCKKIIEVHGGHIWATHNEPKGMIFTFTLPSSAVASMAQGEDQVYAKVQSSKNTSQFEKIFDILQINSDITKVLDSAKEETRIEIARVLLKLDTSINITATITKLSLEVVEQLAADLKTKPNSRN